MKKKTKAKEKVASLIADKLRTVEPLSVTDVQSHPDIYLTVQTLALEFKKRGLPFPHRNSLLLAEKNLRFPKRFHLGGQWSRALWKKSEIEAYFAEAVEERPAERWKSSAELQAELAELRGGAS